MCEIDGYINKSKKKSAQGSLIFEGANSATQTADTSLCFTNTQSVKEMTLGTRGWYNQRPHSRGKHIVSNILLKKTKTQFTESKSKWMANILTNAQI